MNLDELADRIALIAASVDVATHQLLTHVREFDVRDGWAAHGALSCAHWLSWKCGIAMGAAREKVRVAHALGELPRMDEALKLGELSFSKVRALTRVGTAENEEKLVAIGRQTTASQLEKVCRLMEQIQPRDATKDEERRWLRVRDVPGGMVRVEAQLRPEEAARVVAALDVFAGTAEERADALMTMAEATLRGDQPQRPPVEVVLHIDAATLAGNHDGTGVPAETSRRLLCDAGIVPALDDEEGRTLELGRKSRVFSGALRRALLVRSRGRCEFPGCTHDRYLEAHHVVHWIDGGETSMANGAILCSTHHKRVHEGHFKVVATPNGPEFLRADGRPVVQVAPPPRAVMLPEAPLPPTWDGDRVDYDAVVSWALA